MQKDKILIVDDMELNREILTWLLQDEYDFLEAGDGEQAVSIVMNERDSISLILMDIFMPRMDGFEALRILNEGGYTDKIPVIVITSSGSEQNELQVLKNGAVDYIEKPFNPEIIKSRIATHIELKKHRMHLEELVAQSIKKVLKIQDSMIEAMASLIEYRDVESGQHVQRTKFYAQELMYRIKQLNVMEHEIGGINIESASKAMTLHDVGKISIPDQILLKPGRLTEEEFVIMKTHTTQGAKIIDQLVDIGDPQYIKHCRDICLHHHERWDGKGYPCGLKGKQIPFTARIMSIVDSFDAMINDRVYRKALTKEMAVEEIRRNAGTQFDPELADIFVSVVMEEKV